MKNSGNEAKKYLKTKENSFFECCKLRAFWAQIGTNRTLKAAKTAQLAQNEVKLRRAIGGRTTTYCRLVGAVRESALHPVRARRLIDGLGKASVRLQPSASSVTMAVRYALANL
jgi:hypothetical protein